MITPINQQYLSQYVTTTPTGTTLSSPVFIMPSVPPGSVWTLTFAITPASNIKVGQNNSDAVMFINPHADLLNRIVWTLYRNNNAEQSWVGFSQLCNVQLFGNDTVTIIGSGGRPGFPAVINNVNPIPLTLTTLGYQGLETEVPLTVPFISTSSATDLCLSSNSPQANILQISTTKNAFGTTALIPAAAYGTYPVSTVRFWTISLSMSQVSAATNNSKMEVQDASGDVILACGVSSGANGQTASISQDMKGYGVEGNSLFPINLVITNITGGSVTGLVASCNIIYNYDTFI